MSDLTPMKAAPEPSANLLATLMEFLREYASLLEELGDALAPGLATRFQQEVLTPATEAATLGQPRRVIPALLAGQSFTLDRLSIRQPPTLAELGKLRDRLAHFEQELDSLPPPKTRWLSGNTDPHLVVTPAVRQLIAECRTAFSRLAVPLPTGTPERLERLRSLETAIRTLLETAPIDWPPAAAVRLRALADRLQEPFAHKLAQLQDQLYRSLTDNVEPDSTAVVVADCLLELACPDAARLAWLDQVLPLLRGWGSGVGIRFLPENWSFSTPPNRETLGTTGVEMIPVYRQDIPPGLPVRLKVLGVARAEQILRPAVVPVSAGPVPEGLAELEDELHDLTGPIVEVFRQRLKEWRAASLAGTFESTAVDTFVLFWDEQSQPLQNEQPHHFGAMAEKLAQVMRASFGYTLLEPAHFLDFPNGWVQIAEGRLTSGRVRRVLRPGLSDRDGKLRIPACVEVE